MKLKDVSFWCVILVIIVAMVLHHVFSSKRDVIEGTTDGPEKCGDGSFPCCLYNAWYDIEDEQRDTIREILPNGEGNLKTDGTWYMPLSMEGQAPTGTVADAVFMPSRVCHVDKEQVNSPVASTLSMLSLRPEETNMT